MSWTFLGKCQTIICTKFSDTYNFCTIKIKRINYLMSRQHMMLCTNKHHSSCLDWAGFWVKCWGKAWKKREKFACKRIQPKKNYRVIFFNCRMSWAFWLEGVAIPVISTFGLLGETECYKHKYINILRVLTAYCITQAAK